MVIPETIYPESNNKKNNSKIERKTQKPNIKKTSLVEKTTATTDKLNITNVSMEMVVDVTTAATLSSFFLNTYIGDTNKNYKYRDINFELWTQQYGGAEGNLNAIHLDTYISGNGTFAKNFQLYPNKLWNLQQRTMRIGSLTYVPYVKTYYVVSFCKKKNKKRKEKREEKKEKNNKYNLKHTYTV